MRLAALRSREVAPHRSAAPRCAAVSPVLGQFCDEYINRHGIDVHHGGADVHRGGTDLNRGEAYVNPQLITYFLMNSVKLPVMMAGITVIT